MRKNSRIFSVVAMVCLLAVVLTTTVSAKPALYSPYEGYQYNSYGESSAAPNLYLTEKSIDSVALGLETQMSAPSDIVYDEKSTVYVLDSANNRILALSAEDFSLVKIYDNFVDANGDKVSFANAEGFDVSAQGDFYIADTEHTRILIFGNDGVLKRLIARPDDALEGTDTPFDVSKITVDKSGKIYVIASSINSGIMIFDPQGNFESFFGSNSVVATADVIKNYFYNKFLTKEQRASRAKVTPTNFSNMAMDKEGFVYTLKSDRFDFGSSDVLQCLNYKGGDIIDTKLLFGELENDSVSYYQTRLHCMFEDIDIDSDGFLNILDAGRGRVYQYTLDGEMLGSIGAYGAQDGTFGATAAVETVNGKIVVLDSQKNCLWLFGATKYGNDLRKAFLLNDSNDLDARLEAWETVLEDNSNCIYSYYGIGLVYDRQGKYKEAMNNFKIAGYQDEYSKSLEQYRKEIISDFAWLIVLVVIVLVVAGVVLGKIYRNKTVAIDGTAHSPLEQKKFFPLYTLMHPADGFGQFAHRDCYSWGIATVIVLLWFAADTLKYFCTGFAFSTARAVDYNLAVMLFKNIGLFLLFVTGNWSVCTLLNGKGNFKKIYTSVAYSMLPYIMSIFINTILSNVLTQRESVFLTIVTVVGIVWSVLLVLCALINIHQYSFLATLASVLLTFIAMLIIGFLLLLFYSLMLQVWSFITSIVSELKMR